MVLLLLLLACGGDVRGDLDEATIYAVGDSILAWHLEEGGSIPQVAGEQLGEPVYNAAVSGSKLLGPEAIADQYRPGAWDWVLVDGGGNDLQNDCDCRECDTLMEELVSADGRQGALPELVERIRDDGPRVMIVGYYELPGTAQGGFNLCFEDFAELSVRQSALAEGMDGVWFADAREVVTRDALHLYDADHVHPSIEGAEVVGTFVADRMRTP